MPGLQVVCQDTVEQRHEVTVAGGHARQKALDGRSQKCTGTTRGLQQMQGTEVTVGCVSGEVEEQIDHPSASEHFTVVLGQVGGGQGHGYHSRSEHRHPALVTPDEA